MIYLQIALTFLKIGLLSFGGGYAMLPMIAQEVEKHGWLSADAFQHVLVLAGTSPGPIATNSATLVGYYTAGVPGALVAAFGMILPSVVIVLVLAVFIARWHRSPWFQATFYGLKPVVTGLIVFAAIHFGLSAIEPIHFAITWHQIGALLIAAGSFVAVIKFKLHPLAVLVLAGMLGIAFFF
ncbi:chromate transporter [Paenibacillus oryzisoli]|uniref:chromate transporter n=1 Tax=Paenibacillus oryzisoli TaxID=1850517 RepID=UPI003D2BBF0B